MKVRNTGSGIAVIIGLGGIALADPVVDATPEPIPPLFCFRVMDIERVALGDGTPDNDFVFDFEVLNWTTQPVHGLTLALNIGTTQVAGTFPNIAGLSIDRNGRGGPPGGNHIDGSGAGVVPPPIPTTFDSPAVHSGRGRGDIAAPNDWEPTGLGIAPGGPYGGLGTLARWAATPAGTPIPARDLILAGFPGPPIPENLVPGTATDTLGDSAVDGGPAPGGPGTAYTGNPVPPWAGQPDPDGSGNVLDGFVLTIQDFDVDEVLSVNWFLTNASGIPIGIPGLGNQFGFGTINLGRMQPGGPLPGSVVVGNTGRNNTGMTQGGDLFFDGVFLLPNPAEFAAEPGAALTASFANVDDNIFDAAINACPVLPGDANNDCAVTADDLIAVQQFFGTVEPGVPPNLPSGGYLGDANDDGAVTADDLISVQQNFGSALGSPDATFPEPTTIALLIGGTLLALRRRR